MANIRLIVYIEAVDKGEDKIIIYIKAIEGVYIKEINNIEETKE